MLATQDGSLSRKEREGRAILSLDRRPSDNPPFPNVEQETHSASLADLQRFEAALYAARNRWSIQQHRNGLATGKRLSRSDAERALRSALVALGDTQNRLAQYRRGGGQ